MPDSAELHVRLVYDADAAMTQKSIADSLAAIERNTGQAGRAAGGKLDKEMASGFIKGQLALEAVKKGAELLKEAVMKPFDAFAESEKQVRMLASTFLLLGDGKVPFQEIHSVAGIVKDDLEEIAMQAGVTDDEMVAVFSNIVERGGKSIIAAEELAETMAFAGRAIPGGPMALSQAFEQLEMGAVRARNPIVQMIANTGLLKGNAKQVAAEMQKMTPEKQMEMGEKAVAKMAARMKQIPQTMDQMMTSMKVMTGNVLETAGKPMVDAAHKIFEKVHAAFFPKAGDSPLVAGLIRGAEVFGDIVGKVFELGSDFIDGFSSGASQWKSVFTQIYESFFGGGDASFGQWKEIVKFIGVMLGNGAGSLVSGFVTVVGLIKAILKDFTFAIGRAVYGVGDITGSEDTKKAGLGLTQFAYKGEKDEIIDKISKASGGNIQELDAQFTEISKITGLSAADAKRETERLKDAWSDRRVAESTIAMARDDAAHSSTEHYADVFNEMAKKNDEASLTNIASFIKGNDAMKDALVKKGPQIFGEGIDAFTKALRASGQTELADKFTKQRKEAVLGEKDTKRSVNFNGTITIKQDFRDQDPDRVAIVFRREMERSASSILGSK